MFPSPLLILFACHFVNSDYTPRAATYAFG